MDEDELLHVIRRADREGWTSLDLRRQGVTALPPEIGCLTSLTHLDLRDNQITALPPEIGQLTNLAHFDLCHNQLAVLPPSLTRGSIRV